MNLSARCICCLIRGQENMLKEERDDARKSAYFKAIMKMIGNCEEECSAPVLLSRINEIKRGYYGEVPEYREEKERFNRLMLSLADKIEEEILKSQDPLAAAIRYARAGNYIDFGALPEVKEELLLELLEKAGKDELEEETYRRFRAELKPGNRLVYLTDNCGEIVMDKLLVRELKRSFPDLAVTVIVRGAPVLNDATLEDAEFVGLDREAKVIGNGNDVAGTYLAALSWEAKEELEQADLIIAKGQGNFETLKGCGLNIYYLFLCKCELFVERFGMEQYKGVFVNEKNC